MITPRIISGTAKGKRLKSIPGHGTRPITDMVKEALFNILGSDIQDASLLDMFAGTGSVGIEALSRGAAYVRFLELSRTVVKIIQENLVLTKTQTNAKVIQTDSLKYIQNKPDQQFDYIFIAPPQYKGIWKTALLNLDENPNWLIQNGLVIVQIDPKEYEELELIHFTKYEERKYGNTLLVFYEMKVTES